MTYPPSMLLPSVAVYVDGQWVADGRNPYSTDPQVLTDLVVRWGRSTVVDQPQASTCSLTLLDTQGGARFLDTIQLGMRLDVVADALLSDTPGPGTGVVVIDEQFTSGPGNAYTLGRGTIAASGGVLLVTSDGDQSISVVIPPGPRQPVGGNPAAWDGIPRAAQGQTWTASVDVKLPAPFAGYSGWDVQVYPVTYDSPWDVATALAELGTSADLGNGWVRVSGEFVPPTGAWLGVQVRLWPIGPAWDELDASIPIWPGLPFVGVLTNLATNPTPASATGWLSNNGTVYTHTFNAADQSVQVERKAGASDGMAATVYGLGNLSAAQAMLLPGVRYQRSVEIWTDAPATVDNLGGSAGVGGFVGGHQIPANTWTQVVEQFTGTGVAQYVMGLKVTIPGLTALGVHCRMRRAMLVAIPADGPAVPYFDGSTPDTATTDYSWSGTANASTSSAAGLVNATTWDELPGATGVRTNLATNPGYEVGTNSIFSANAAQYAQTADTTSPIAGLRSALLTRAGTMNTIVANILCYAAQLAGPGRLPVTPGQVVTGGLSIKTDVASARISTRWQWVDSAGAVVNGPETSRVTGMVPGQVYRVSETATANATAASAIFNVIVYTPTGNTVVGQRVWADLLTLEYGTTDGSYFDGSTPDTPAVRYDWTGSPNASTSTATGLGVAVTWDELGRMAVDNVSLKAPAGGTQRTGMVFSGRITDMVAQFDDTAGGTVVDITGADQRAELGNRDVGDEPWLEEPLGNRFGRIVTASGQPIESRVSPTAAAMMVSWRDVDRQPAMTLLSELATSADGVLWAATHPTTGPYLLLESLSDRPPQFVLVKGADGVIRISTADPSVTGALTIDACDILLAPIRWRHDVQDMATRVAVTWREQTLDDKGQPAPTDRTITQVNPLLEADIGVHRVAVGTQLSREADAQLVSDAVLARTSNTQWRVSGLDWRADTTDQLNADALARMMTLLDGTTRNGLPILLTNVPEWSPIPQDAGVALYLEGGVYTSTDGGWDLSLITSSARAQGGADVAWDDQPADWTWDQYDPAVTWNALHGVGIS